MSDSRREPRICPGSRAMNTDLQREEEIFDAARQISDAPARSAYLDRACRGEPLLRARVDELLESTFAAEQFFAEGGAALKQAMTSLHATRGTAGGGPASARVAGEEAIGT